MGHLEEIVTSDGRRTTPVRRTTLSEAQAWLAPAFAQQLRTSHSPDSDWWPALRIELLNLARRWLDADRSLVAAGPGATITTPQPRWWRASAARHQVRVRSPLSSRLALLNSASGRNTVLKERGADLRVRAAASRGVPSRVPSGRVGTAFVCEVPTPSMLQGLLATATDEDVIIAADPRCQRAAYDAGLSVVSLWSSSSTLRSPPALREAAAILHARLSSVDSGFADVAAKPTARLLTDLITHRDAVRERLTELKPSVIAMASDQHRYGVLAVWVANEVAVPSVVFQHGLIADPAGFFPPRADWFLTVDEASSQRYVDAGIAWERVVAVGLPRAAQHSLGSRDPRYLVVPLQPIHTPVADELLDLVADLQVPVVLRVHPGDATARTLNDEELLARFGWRGPQDVVIDRAPEADGTLSQAGLVVTHDSTFALDAALQGVPVAIFSPRHAASPLAGAFPAFTLEQELRDHWSRARGSGAPSPGSAGLLSGEGAVSAARSVLEGLR